MRIRTALTCLIAPLALTLAACGGDSGGGGGKGSEVTDANTVTAAKGTAEATKSLTALMPGTDAANGQGAVSQVGGSVMNLVNGYRAAQLQAASGAIQQAQATPGSFSYENDHISADFTYASGGYNVQYLVELDVPAVDGGRQIDGTVDMSFQVMQGYNIDFTYNAVYDAMTLDAAGCATGGSIVVNYDMQLSGPSYDAQPPEAKKEIAKQWGDGKLTVEFGPACGDVKVFGT